MRDGDKSRCIRLSPGLSFSPLNAIMKRSPGPAVLNQFLGDSFVHARTHARTRTGSLLPNSCDIVPPIPNTQPLLGPKTHRGCDLRGRGRGRRSEQDERTISNPFIGCWPLSCRPFTAERLVVRALSSSVFVSRLPLSLSLFLSGFFEN